MKMTGFTLIYIAILVNIVDNLRDKTARSMGNVLTNLPNLAMAQTYRKYNVNHIGKCLWYFHPSYGSDSRELQPKFKRFTTTHTTFQSCRVSSRFFIIRQR